jgi:hypothetical protein
MDKELLKYFWNCGDNQIIEFAIMRARLNSKEKMVLECILDGCLTQEQTAEKMGYSTRRVQEFRCSAVRKLLNIDWVRAYAISLREL